MVNNKKNPYAYSNLPAAGVVINVLGLFLLLFAVIIGWLVTDSHFKQSSTPQEVN